MGSYIGKLKNKWQSVPLTVKVSTAYAVCSILQRCLTYLTMPLFTRIMSKAQYGQVTVYASWQGILQIFLTLNLAYWSYSTAMVKFEDDREGYISAIQGICVALSAAFLVIYLPFRHLWNQLFELPTWIMLVMIAEILAMTCTQMWNGKKRFEFRYISVVVITLAVSVLSPLLQYLLVVNWEEKGFARIVGSAIVTVLLGGFFFVFNSLKGKKLFHREYWKYALGFNVPLLAYYLSQVVFNQSDRIMISHISGTDKAASYGVAYGLAMMLTFVLNAINNSYLPWYYGKIKEGKETENRKVALGIAGLMALLLTGVIWFAPEIILIMGGEKYAEAVYVVPPVAVSLLLLFYSQLFINVEFYYEEKKSLVYASIGAALANLVLNWIFIRIFGFVAAAYTTLVSYVLFAVCNCFAMKKVLKKREKEDAAYDYRGLLLILGALCVLAVAGRLLYGTLIVRAAVTCVVLLVLFIKRKELAGFLRIFRKKEAQ